MDESIVPVNQLAVRSSTGYEFSNPNGAEVVEIEDDDTSVETVKKQMEYLKLNHQFNEKDVPAVFKFLINCRMTQLKVIDLQFRDSFCQLEFDDVHIIFVKENDDWLVIYDQINTTKIESDDPMKFMIDHLWFVLKNSNIKLEKLAITGYKDLKTENRQKLDTLLQSMIDSIDHQIQTTCIKYGGFNEDTFFSMLKKVKPGALETIIFGISWKEEGNYQKMKEIVETDQWKQAKRIDAPGVTPLKIEDLLQYKQFWLLLDNVTLKDVQCATEHFFNFSGKNQCVLACEKLDIDAIMDGFRSQNDGVEVTKTGLLRPNDKFCYRIVKSKKFIIFFGTENYIHIRRI